jgi:TetR/AcrR family transcriptional regulator, cholesterol catabolism regulator
METKDRIIQGAIELFFRFGIKSITMDDIAKHLSMSKKTIYQFFRDKDEIVHTMFALELEKDQREFQEIADKAGNVVEEVFMFMKKMHQIFGSINPSIFYDLQKYHPQTWALFRTFREECAEIMITKSLEKGKLDGLVRKDINIPLLSRLRMEELEMGLNVQIFPADKFKMLDVQLAIAEHFLYGICTLKGHKLINKYKHITEEE